LLILKAVNLAISTPDPQFLSAPHRPAAIHGHNISKWFYGADGEPLLVLSDVTIDVPAQSIVAIVGTSGCGKSTLLNIIAGIAALDRGEIAFDGIAARQFNDWRSIGYMFQEDRLLPWRTAARNVDFGLEGLNLSRRERRTRVEDALEIVGLTGFADAFPYQLSGGMRSRVALARCLAARPTTLLMDEPFSKLDAQTRAALHRELLRLRDMAKLSILFVTHDIDEAVALADQVVVLSARPGRVTRVVDVDLPKPRDPADPAVVDIARLLRQELMT
jgi:NitT/TauT family transport system ATP-binding protein